MSAREEEVHGYEAIIKALIKDLTDKKGSPTDSLKPPTFDWNSSDQYKDFHLFIKGMESWYTLQGIPATDGDTTRLEYLLNVLGPIGRRKHKQWNPSGATAQEQEKNKKRTKLFMDFLHSSMDHAVSQWCRIYQLEEIRIKAGETPDELVEWIRGLADRCNFPTDAEKERHIQFRMVHALSDTDLIRKLLAMKIKATTAKMLAVWQTHIAIADNMSSKGLATKAISTVQKMKKPQSHGSPCSNCTKVTLQEESIAQQRIPLVMLARMLVTGSRSAGSQTRPRIPTRNPSCNFIINLEEGKRQMK